VAIAGIERFWIMSGMALQLFGLFGGEAFGVGENG
jgi:hypothetical protein